MTEPFAKVVQETSVSGAEGFSVVIEGEECCPPWGNWMREGADVFASRVNTAARKYAADKIREAADFEDGLALIIEKNIVANEAHYRKYPGGKPGQLQSAREKREVAQRLRNHADAVEIGEA